MNHPHTSRPTALLSVLLGLSVLLTPMTAKAEEIRRFVIPAHDGYDLEDCMTSGNSCAQIVANAWCDAKGYNQAIAFEPVQAGEITASLASSVMRSSPRNGVLITCSK